VDESVPGSANLWAEPSCSALFLPQDDQNMRSEAQFESLRKEKIAICDNFTARSLDAHIGTP
jgi:hypothetical protein